MNAHTKILLILLCFVAFTISVIANETNSCTANSFTFTLQPSATDTTYCVDTSPAVLRVDEIAGANYQWFCKTDKTASDSVHLGENAQMASFSPPTSIVHTGLYYYCIVSNGAEATKSDYSGKITVSVPPVAGKITPSSPSLREGDTQRDLVLSDNVGSIIQWQECAKDNFFTDIEGATTPKYNMGDLSAGIYFYRAEVSIGGCYTYTTPVPVEVIANRSQLTNRSLKNPYRAER